MSYRYGGIGYETVLSVDTAQRDSGGAAIPMLYLFDTADDADEAEAEQYLSKLTAGEFSPLMYESKATARSEFAQFRQMFLLIGGILCAIIGLVGQTTGTVHSSKKSFTLRPLRVAMSVVYALLE